ncbi:MAG: outer membrane beta-barrel protein [Gammaproteobacteria bacterium]|nr:outer membrane beta-barrel protein [Gammaproteobacteria bacterium]
MATTRSLIVLMIVGLLASGPAMAVKGGFYLGGSVGGATTEVSESGVTFDENDTAWKLFAGYHFLQFFAVEAAYRDFGSPSTDIQGSDVKVSSTAFDVAGLGGIPLGPVYLFAKLGLAQWDADVTVDGTKISDDGTDIEVGIGLSVDVIKIQLRGEVEYLDAADGVFMYTVGAAWRF